MTELAPHGGCNWKGCRECFPDLGENTENTENTEDPSFSLLVADILMAQDTYLLHNAVIKAFKRQALIAEATLDLIRAEVQMILSGNYMPMPDRIKDALYPRQDDIKRLVHKRTEEDYS